MKEKTSERTLMHTIKKLIWDLSGTILKPTRKDISLLDQKKSSLIYYAWSEHKNPSESERIAISILEKSYSDPDSSYKNLVKLHDGNPLPDLISGWLIGQITSNSAIEIALNQYYLEKQEDRVPFDLEKQLEIKEMLQNFFDPYAISNIMDIQTGMFDLVIKYKELMGTKNNYILSNWDPESFELLKNTKNCKKLFEQYEDKNIVISGDCGYIKPELKIFEYFLGKYELDPKECLFIDDQKENIEKAKGIGIKTILFINHKELELSLSSLI